MQLTRVAFALLSVLSLGLSVVLWPREYDAVYLSVQQQLDWVLAPTTVSLTRPGSIEGHYLTLSACDQTVASIGFALAPAQERDRIAQNCLDVAERILSGSPSLSLAHMVRAQTLFALGQNSDAFEALGVAELTGGGLAWMATRRLDLAMRRLADSSDSDRSLVERDIRRLLEADRDSVEWVARRYTRSTDDAIRQLIIDVVEQSAEFTQRQFVNAVRRVG